IAIATSHSRRNNEACFISMNPDPFLSWRENIALAIRPRSVSCVVWIAAIVAVCAGSDLRRLFASDNTLLQRLKVEVPAKWEVALERGKQLSCKFSFRENNNVRNGSVSMATEGEEILAGGRYITRIELRAPTEQLEGVSRSKNSYAGGLNGKYEFDLQ